MKDEKMFLTNGKEVLRGPWVHPTFFNNEIEVGVFVVSHEIEDPVMRERCGKAITILKINVPFVYYGIEVPCFQILEKELWTANLIKAVVCLLQVEEAYKTALGYVAANLAAAFKQPKELKLADGSRFIGDFDYSFNAVGHTLEIIGNVKDAMDIISKVTVLTVEGLDSMGWPHLRTQPTYRKNENFWCKGLDSLVTSYLEVLAKFSGREIALQIRDVIGHLCNHTEWSMRLRHLMAKLSTLPADRQEDPKIIEGMAMIEAACNASS